MKDLEYDTLQFKRTIALLHEKLLYYDSAFHFFQHPTSYNHYLPFRFYFKTSLEQFYTPAKPTIEQLKGSGNLRLIHKKLALDSILIYDSRLGGGYKNQTEFVIEANKRLIQSFETIFDLTNFNLFINDKITGSQVNDLSSYDVQLISDNKVAIQKVYNIYISSKATDFFYMQLINSTKKIATRLILF